MPATLKDQPATLEQLLQPKPVAVDLDAHQIDMARRQAEHDTNREELMKCCNPAYAQQREIEKPQYVWAIEVDWFKSSPTKGMVNYYKKKTVIAQCESDAWSMFCDAIGAWPSRRDAKVTIKRGRQLTPSQIAAQSTTTAGTGIARMEFKSNDEPAWVEA